MQAFIVSDHESISGRVRQVLLFEGLDCQASHVVSLDLADHHLAKEQPELLVVVLSLDPERALSVLGELRRKLQSRVLVVGPASSKLVLRALRGGAAVLPLYVPDHAPRGHAAARFSSSQEVSLRDGSEG